MQNGAATEARNAAMDRLESALLGINAAYLAEHPGEEDPVNHVGSFGRSDNSGVIFAEISKNVDRKLEASDITRIWRERAGEIAGVKEMTFSDGSGFCGGPPLSFNLTGNSLEMLQQAAGDLQNRLEEYDGVFDITSSLDAGGDEIRLGIKPQAEALGLTMSSLGRQVRQAFYGEEAQRVQRGKDELKVMVRYPRAERRSIADLENMRIRTPSGDEVPFASVAEVHYGQAYSSISRQNRKRTVTVSADVDLQRRQPGKIIKEISDDYMPGLRSRYPGVDYSLEGSSREQVELVHNLTYASIAALFLIYALIAIPLRSYTQPLVIMSVIPFGLIGAVIGHIVMGKAISMFSLFGLIALAGVVVNDSLIMVDFINRARADGVAIKKAVMQSGIRRFRAIILTSLTTAVGLMPIMFEKSVQAQYVTPMAISMSFGIVFATIITLFLIPALYLLLDDWSYSWRKAMLLITGKEEAYNALTKMT